MNLIIPKGIENIQQKLNEIDSDISESIIDISNSEAELVFARSNQKFLREALLEAYQEAQK